MSKEAQTDNRPYWQKLRDLKLGKTTTAEESKKEVKQDLTAWYNEQAKQAPGKCENCGKPLLSTINFHPRAHICHIVKKTKEGGCPSVATHPLNRWFGCKSCHDAYDDESPDVVQTMTVIPIVKERLAEFYPLIAADEVRRVPFFLVPEISEKVVKAKDLKPTPKPVKKNVKATKTTGKKRGRKPGTGGQKRESRKTAAPSEGNNTMV